MYKVNLDTYKSNISDIKIFNDWNIININTDLITLKNNKIILKNNKVKKVSFSDNIELYQSSTKVRVKDKMSNYGKEPNAIEKFVEEFLYKLTVFENLNFNKFKLMPSLKMLNLYYPLMYNLINTHYLLSNNKYKFIYTKHTFIRPHSIIKINKFINEYTDLMEKFIIIRKFIKNISKD